MTAPASLRPRQKPSAPDARRVTEYAYNADGQLERLTLVNAVTGNQVTRWIFGTTLADSGVAQNDLVSGKVWPTGESESLAYNRQGDVIRRTDPNGSVRQFTHNRLGQLIDDAATTVADGVDATLRRVSTAYNNRKRLTWVTVVKLAA